jgi:hypothetical protein
MPNLEDNLDAKGAQELLKKHGFSSYRFDNGSEEVKFGNIKDWCSLGDKLGIDYKPKLNEITTDEYQEVSFNYRGWNFKSGTFNR